MTTPITDIQEQLPAVNAAISDCDCGPGCDCSSCGCGCGDDGKA